MGHKSKRGMSILLAGLLLLSACAAPAVEVTPSPSEAVTPTAAPTATPEPTEEVETLWGFPIDDTHDAFEVDTKGKLGTLLVTVEMGEQNTESEFGGFYVTFCVWSDPLDSPIQVIKDEMERWVIGEHNVVDANFDGHTDFAYLWGRGIQVEMWSLWLWDEEAGQFVEEPEYSAISSPRVNPETQVIDGWNRNSAAGDGVTTFHRWEDGKLVCVRRIELFTVDYAYDDSPWLLTVQDRVNGELTEVFRMECPWDSDDCFSMRMAWKNLDYHGEEG